jgi:GDP-4-dehydro-6-deoxy-D-mannose reductase
MKRRILVTGSTGYIGRALTKRLQTLADTDIYGFNRNPDLQLPSERRLEGDITDADWTAWLTAVQPHLIFHMIGASPASPFAHQLLVNVEGTRRLLQALADTGQRPKIIIAGSAAEYGLRDEAVDEMAVCRPEGEYGIAKLAQTEIARSFARRHDLPVVIARIFNVYGETDRHLAIASLASQIARAEAVFPEPSELHVYNLRSWRDFIHIDDVTEALIALAANTSRNETSGQIYNVAFGRSVPVTRVVDRLLSDTRLSGPDLKKVSLSVHGVQREDVSRADTSKIRQHTGWIPKISLKEGLHRELEYWRAQIATASREHAAV